MKQEIHNNITEKKESYSDNSEIENIENVVEKGYIFRMPIKMHTDLKLSALFLHKNMQDILLEALTEKLNQLKETNEKIGRYTKDKCGNIKENNE
jgi:hypothetical protein